jgi:hypothetical protein
MEAVSRGIRITGQRTRLPANSVIDYYLWIHPFGPIDQRIG